MSDRPTAVEQARLVTEGETTGVALVDRSLAAVERWQPMTNAYSQVFADEARAAAAVADAARADGTQAPRLLEGVPIAVKDLFDMAGHATTGSSRFYEHNVVASTATAVQRFLDAGAIVIGKTNQHELAMGGTNVLSAHGPTHNPFDPTRITGGSSGGSAAALATDTVAIALGTDTGGSIRNPASMCGLFGLKPTQDRIPVDGVLPLAPSLDCPGPMAKTAADLALAWRVLSDEDRPVTPVTRVGLLGGYFAGPLHPSVREAVRATVEALDVLDIDVVDIDGEGAEPFFAAWGDLVCMELVESHPGLADGTDLLFPRTASFVERGVTLLREGHDELRDVPRTARTWFAERLDDVDVLLAPSSPYPAPIADDDDVDLGEDGVLDIHLGGTSRYTRPVSMAGYPALTIPAGMSDDGLPVGVQLIGRWDGEHQLLGLAAFLEAADPRFRSSAPPG